MGFLVLGRHLERAEICLQDIIYGVAKVPRVWYFQVFTLGRGAWDAFELLRAGGRTTVWLNFVDRGRVVDVDLLEAALVSHHFFLGLFERPFLLLVLGLSLLFGCQIFRWRDAP